MESPDHGNIDDIEDIVDAGSETITRLPRSDVTLRQRKSKVPPSSEKPQGDSIIPGCGQTVYVRTWGCSHNASDGEYMAGQLAAAGYTVTTAPHLADTADVWLLNSCTVKTPAEDHFRNEINSAKAKNIPCVIAGCVPQAAPKTGYMKGLSIIGVQQIDRVVEVIEQTLQGHTVRLLGTKRDKGRRVGGADLQLPKIRKNPLIEILAINTGCLNRCTYCKTKQARGDLASYSIQELVDRARQSFEEGCVEVWLTSEDLGAYGRDIGVTLPDLLHHLVKVIPQHGMMRLGMTNPPYILDHLEEMSVILNHPNVYSFLHVPVQSGSDAVLGEMKREYTREHFCRVVDFLKERVPDLTVATDLICGFPTETDDDFEETISLVRRYKFPSLFINQYFPRPGTPAAALPRVDPREVKRRTGRVSELFQSYTTYDEKVGRVTEVLVTEEAKDGRHWVAHNKSYDQVLVPRDETILGKKVTVRLVSAGKHYLQGELVDGAHTRKQLNSPVASRAAREAADKQLQWIAWSMPALLMLLAISMAFKCWHLATALR